MSLSRIKALIVSHKIISAIIIIAVVGGGYYFYRTRTAALIETTYTLAPVTKGTLITSVTGSGQVSATNQLNVTPQASGTVRYVGVTQGQTVKAGTVLIRLNDITARKAVRDAQANLASAQLAYDKLVRPADQLSITQAENAVTGARQSLTQAQQTLIQYQQTSVRDVATAYEDGYNSASNAFLDMPSQMNDLMNLRGTSVNGDANVSAFQIILGENSPLITNWVRDHDAAIISYNDSFTYFKTIPRVADNGTRYELISKTSDTEEAVSQALLSAHAMLDAVVNTSYKQYNIAGTVDTYRPKILADISQINGDITSIQHAKDTIDNNTLNGPITLQKNQDAIISAQGNLDEKTQSLAKLKAGPDPIDIQSAKLSLQKSQNSLNDAGSNLADYVVTAPFDGTVATFALSVGDQVSSGTTVTTMVTSQRFVDVTLNEVDVVKAKAGQKATLTFDAISELSISGTVASVDLLGTVSQGVVNYGVRIMLDTQDDRVRPSMSATANIVTNVKSDVLLVPSSAVKTQGNETYVEMFDGHQSADDVTVMTADKPRRQTVVVGDSNDASTEITEGLREGENIVVKITTSASSTAATRAAGGFGIPGLGGTARVGGGAGGGFRGN